jgi:hypothetical protein
MPGERALIFLCSVSPESEEESGAKIIKLYGILTAVAGAVIALGMLAT